MCDSVETLRRARLAVLDGLLTERTQIDVGYLAVLGILGLAVTSRRLNTLLLT